MPVSMLSGRAIAAFRRHQANLFQTGLTLADPPVALTLSRWNGSAFVDLASQTVLVRWAGDKGMRGGTGGLVNAFGASPTAMDGLFTAFEPFDVRTGDRFVLDGLSGHVGMVRPVRNGRRMAGFVLDTDTRTGP